MVADPEDVLAVEQDPRTYRVDADKFDALVAEMTGSGWSSMQQFGKAFAGTRMDGPTPCCLPSLEEPPPDYDAAPPSPDEDAPVYGTQEEETTE